MFKLLKVSSEVIITLVVVVAFFLAWIVMEYGPSILAIFLVAGAVALVYRKQDRRCRCELCDSVYHNDPRMITVKRQLESIDSEAPYDIR